MPKTSTVAELAAILRQEGESEDLKFFVQGSEVAADIRLGDTQVARGAVVQLVRIKRPPPVVTRRTSSPDWNRIPCTCFTDFCEFHVLAASGQTTCKFMRDLLEGDMVRTGSSVESEKYRQISRIWCCTAGLTQTVEVEQGCKLTVSGLVRYTKVYTTSSHRDTVYCILLSLQQKRLQARSGFSFRLAIRC